MAEVEPVWQHAAVELEVQGLSWPPLPTGFSLAFWMSVDLPVHGSKAEFKSSSKIKRKFHSQKFILNCGCSLKVIWGHIKCLCFFKNKSFLFADKDFSDNKTQQFVPRRLQIKDCLLVAALGNKEKMFEVWVHPATASLVCRWGPC